jgi:polyhydroxybutyrate depolymerase
MRRRLRVGSFVALCIACAHCGSSSAGASAAGSTTTGSDSGACGTRTGMRGKTTRTVMVDGTSRSYVAYLPQSVSPTKATPFVYVFHGADEDGQNLFDMTQYSTLADSEGIAVVFPDGQGVSSATSTTTLAPWNVSDNGAAVCGDGNLVNNKNAVDFAFMDAIKTDMLQDQCLDANHTFATGFSMGGYFTHHIACDRTDIKAAAPHSGGTLASLSTCKTGHVPIIIFHGTADPLIVPGCDDPNSPAQTGFPPSATLWAQKNGCKATYTTMPTNGSGGGDGQCYLYDGCPADGQVELCTFTGMEHAWAGAQICPSCIGSGATYASATQLEWAFFKKYAW